MIRCLDIHTHHAAPQPMGVINSGLTDFNPIDGQLYSLGIHPWETDKGLSAEEWERFEKMAALPCVVAIGECGVDKLKGGPLFRQLNVMKKHIEISEKLRKPLIIHDVKAHDIITGLKRDINPTQNWMVHGMRGKPTVVKMLTDAGIFVSFGARYNPESPAVVPSGMILAETDEAPEDIIEIIASLSETLGRDLLNEIADNTKRFLNLQEEF